jgi:hypothetical protein
MDRPCPPARRRARRGEVRTSVVVAAVGLAVVAGFVLTTNTVARQGDRIDRRLAELEERVTALAGRPERGPASNPAAGQGTLDEKVDALRGDLDILVSDVQRLERKIDSLTSQLENRGVTSSEPQQPPDLDWTQPDLFETARKGAESVGLTLSKDELRAPARLVLKEGLLEYFAVLKGGKEHEALFSIVGNTPAEARRPRDLGVKFSNAIQALGVKRGKPIRFSPNGTQPAQGETIRIFVEWTTHGKTELVRAEDLVWHKDENRPMKPGSFVFVGSTFVAGEEAGTLDFAADLTAEAIATYSAPASIIDNVEEDAQDDTVFLAATPRIPDDVQFCTLIFRKADLAGVKEFPPAPGGGR